MLPEMKYQVQVIEENKIFQFTVPDNPEYIFGCGMALNACYSQIKASVNITEKDLLSLYDQGVWFCHEETIYTCSLGKYRLLVDFETSRLDVWNTEGKEDQFITSTILTKETVIECMSYYLKIKAKESVKEGKPTEKELLAMPLHSSLEVDDFTLVQRVVGGWRYVNTIYSSDGTGYIKADGITSVFVPERRKPNPQYIHNDL
jgi:hypothetical protein